MKDLLESPKEAVEGEFEEHVVSGSDDDDDDDDYSRRACSIMSSDTSEAGSVVWSEYTVRSIASWKERTSWFFHPACGKKGRGVAQMLRH